MGVEYRIRERWWKHLDECTKGVVDDMDDDGGNQVLGAIYRPCHENANDDGTRYLCGIEMDESKRNGGSDDGIPTKRMLFLY